jgi:hypothetical protein
MTKVCSLHALANKNLYSMFNKRGEAWDQYRSCIDPHSFLISWKESSQSKQWTELARAQNKMEVSKRIIDPHEFIWFHANPDPDQERHA